MFSKTLAVSLLVFAGMGEQVVLARTASASTLKVPEQHPTIQAALDLTSPGDTVLVAPGLYSAVVTRNLSNGGTTTFCANIPSGVVLRSEAGAASTEIHLPANDAPISYALIVEGDSKGWYPVPWTTIEGFTVTADLGTGGGCVFYTARVRIRDCQFKNLVATPSSFIHGGGAIAAMYSEIDAEYSHFEDCQAERGGAVYGLIHSGFGAARFRNCTFRRCTGAAVRYSAGSADVITNAAVECEDCVFEENMGGAVLYGSSGNFPEMNAYLVCRRCSFRSNREGVLFSSGFRAVAIEDCEFIENVSSTTPIIELHGSDEFEFNEPSSVSRNLFVRNTAEKAIVEWNVAGGRFENNFFTGGNAQEYSVAYLSPYRSGPYPPTIQVAGNLCERNGPSPLFGIPHPEGVPASCNIVWENTGTSPDLAGFISIDPQLCESGSGSARVAASSPCFPENAGSVCGRIGNVEEGCAGLGTTSIGLASNHVGREVSIDGSLHRTPSMFTGYPSDQVQLNTLPIQMTTTSERYIWDSWSDGGEIEHSITLSTPVVYAAEFNREYLLRTTAGDGGTSEPLEQWVGEGSSAIVTAIPDAHYTFQSWAGVGPGSYTGANNPATVTMNGPVYETASFALKHYAVSIVAGPGGEVSPASGTFVARSVVRIEARPDQIHTFSAWIGSGPGSYTGTEPVVDIVVEGPIEQRAVFTPIAVGYTLTLSASGTDPGVTTASPANGWRRIYFWASCLDRGISAFEAEVSTEMTIGSFEPLNGVLNAGNKNHLLIAIPGCPTGPNADFLLGSWNVFDTGGEICLIASTETGNLAAVDCDTPNPHLWKEPIVEGFASDGEGPCVTGSIGCATVQMDPTLQELFGRDPAPRDASTATTFSSIQPNPFISDTSFHFQIHREVPVQVSIFDVRGRLVTRLFEGALEKGSHRVTWDGRDDSHRVVSPGIFFARFQAGDFVQVRKLVRIESR